jgi:hypothetical protein
MPAQFDARNFYEFMNKWKQLFPLSKRDEISMAPDRALRSTVSFDKSNQLSIRFCLEPEIERKRRILSIHKQQFLVKCSNLKVRGQQQKLLSKLFEWLHDEYDKF